MTRPRLPRRESERRAWLWLMSMPSFVIERRDGWAPSSYKWYRSPHVWLFVKRPNGEHWVPWTGPTVPRAVYRMLRSRRLTLDRHGREVALWPAAEYQNAAVAEGESCPTIAAAIRELRPAGRTFLLAGTYDEAERWMMRESRRLELSQREMLKACVVVLGGRNLEGAVIRPEDHVIRLDLFYRLNRHAAEIDRLVELTTGRTKPQ